MTDTTTHLPARSLEDAICVVTGGGKGIGAAVSAQIAQLGGRVLIVDQDKEAAERLAASLDRAQAAPVDVSDYDAVEGCLRAFERVDVLVNNAGWDKVEPFVENDPALWDQLIAVNLKGVFNFSHLVLPKMSAGGGRIVNVASDAGRVGSSGEAVYSACKGGVIAFTKSIAREAARHRVTVNCVCPGPTDTALLAEIKASERAARTMEAIVRATPLRRLAQPDEVAEAVVFFATAPDHITGQVLSVSGGLTMAG